MRHDYEPREPLPLKEPHEITGWTFCRCIAYPFAVFGVVVVLFLASLESEAPFFSGILQWIVEP